MERTRTQPRFRDVAVFVVVTLALSPLAQACLWDWDTLQMERRRFPGTLEMITGKFVRHSRAYHEWRIRDRLQRMYGPAEDPELADDLAVSLSKLGKHADGIEILEEVVKVYPDRYETLSNLGTLHMLAGDLKTGKDFIDRAIVINPDAHFGRERYQSLLAEYYLTARKSPHPIAENGTIVKGARIDFGFGKFIIEKRKPESRSFNDEEIKVELGAAVKGVLGMMHFANYDSPLLLEALGDLLIVGPTRDDNAVQLAARAYYRIGQVSADEATREEFKAAARNALFGHMDYIRTHAEGVEVYTKNTRDDLEKLSDNLKRELTEAETFVAAIAADEKRWIADGADVDHEFASKYYDSIEETIEAAKRELMKEPIDVRGNPYQEAERRAVLILGGILLGIFATIAFAIFAMHRIRSHRMRVSANSKG